MKPITEWS